MGNNIEGLIHLVEKVSDLQKEHRELRITILGVPYYSIQALNNNRNQPPLESDKEDDTIQFSGKHKSRNQKDK